MEGMTMLQVECTRFKVKEGKSAVVDEWLQFLNDNMKDVLVTLEGEKMYVETILREHKDGSEYLYWYSVQGPGGIDVEESTHWIDVKHLAYWDKCIDNTFRPEELTPAVVMIPQRVRQVMQ